MRQHRIGKITHYYRKLGVAALELEEPLRVGDRVHIAGHTTDLEQPVESLEIEHRRVSRALPGQSVAVRVIDRVRPGDDVLLEEEEADEELMADIAW
jgi:putative protease